MVAYQDQFSGTGSCQKIMGVGLCTYDATATAVETMTTQAGFYEDVSCTKHLVSVGSFTWLHHLRYNVYDFSTSACTISFNFCLYPVFSEWHQRFFHAIGWMRIIVHLRVCWFHAQCTPLLWRSRRWLLQPTPPTTATQALAASRMSRRWECRDCPVDFCSPKCNSSGTCPSDVPKGDTATPECALRTTTGDKYCALICQSDSDCGT